jgi:hypothetical protein
VLRVRACRCNRTFRYCREQGCRAEEEARYGLEDHPERSLQRVRDLRRGYHVTRWLTPKNAEALMWELEYDRAHGGGVVISVERIGERRAMAGVP